MQLLLERWASTIDGTVGRLTERKGLDVLTLEKPWRDNRRMISCVPAGVYELVPHQWKGETDTYALVSKELGVRHWPHAENLRPSTRDLILFHPANWEHQLHGCIATGMAITKQLSRHTSKIGLLSSRVAFGKLMQNLGTGKMDKHTLKITWGRQQEGLISG